MFIKAAVFKRLIKDAWKQSNLVVGVYHDLLNIKGNGWQMAIDPEKLPNKLKGQLVELTGELALSGEAYKFGPGGAQATFEETIQWLDFSSYPEEGKEWYSTHMVTISTDGEALWLQDYENDHITVDRKLYTLYDPTEIDGEKGETVPAEWKQYGRYLLTRNNTMVLSIDLRTPQWTGEAKIKDVLRGHDLNYDFER